MIVLPIVRGGKEAGNGGGVGWVGSEPHKILHIETEFLVWFVVIVELRANTLMAFLWSSHMTDKSQLKKKRAVGPGECVCRRYEFSVGTGQDI